MGRGHRAIACALGLAVGALASAGASARDSAAGPPAVARAHLRGGEAAGAVFFLPAEGGPGAVAVGAAHSFDATRLAEAGELTFRLPGRDAPVAASSRYFAMPGRAYHEPGATLRDDFVLFALDRAPEGVRLLRPSADAPRPGDRVRILGTSASGATAELLGTVARSEPARLEVDLDGPADLRGWGGAPVLHAEGGGVVGLLQSAWPHEGGWRTGVGPIGGVREALTRPFEAGIGRLFATLAPAASAANDASVRRRVATRSPFGDPEPPESAARVAAAAQAPEPPPAVAAPPLRLEIEHPAEGASVGDAAGVFLAGRAVSSAEARPRLDVVVALDTSASTAAPSGLDLDGDGVVGAPRPGASVASAESASSDPGDSVLAAEVAAARRLLADLDPRTTRVGLVTFAGDVAPAAGSLARLDVRRAALTEEPLTSDYDRIRRALDGVLVRGPGGMTHMAAGLDQATLELLGLEGSISLPDPGSQKVVLFLTDGQPTLPHPGADAANVRTVLEASLRARRAGVRVHSFAIGAEALAGPLSTVEMASLTDGLFTPVRDPARLVRSVELVRFADVAEVRVVNATRGEEAYQVRVHADGSWDALVPLAPGENRLEVRARASDGREAAAQLRVSHVPSERGPLLPVELVPRHNALLEDRLAALEWERIEAVRKELVLEIERERATAVQRAARQRKELEIEVERPEGP